MNKLTALTLAAAFSILAVSAQASSDIQGADTAPAVPQSEPQSGPIGDSMGGPEGGPPAQGPRGGAERFENADLNKDGFLTKEEMAAMQQQRLDRMFEEADVNKDGKLSPEELDTGFKMMREKMRARFEESKQKAPY